MTLTFSLLCYYILNVAKLQRNIPLWMNQSMNNGSKTMDILGGFPKMCGHPDMTLPLGLSPPFLWVLQTPLGMGNSFQHKPRCLRRLLSVVSGLWSKQVNHQRVLVPRWESQTFLCVCVCVCVYVCVCVTLMPLLVRLYQWIIRENKLQLSPHRCLWGSSHTHTHTACKYAFKVTFSSSTTTGCHSPREPASLWSGPSGALRGAGRCRTASFVGRERRQPHQYLCCPISRWGEGTHTHTHTHTHDLEHCVRMRSWGQCFGSPFEPIGRKLLPCVNIWTHFTSRRYIAAVLNFSSRIRCNFMQCTQNGDSAIKNYTRQTIQVVVKY